MRVPFGELHGAGVAILALPVEVPVLDPDERLDAAVGQVGVHLHLFAEPVRVRRDADQFDILRDDGGVGHGGELRPVGDRGGADRRAGWRGPFAGRSVKIRPSDERSVSGLPEGW